MEEFYQKCKKDKYLNIKFVAKAKFWIVNFYTFGDQGQKLKLVCAGHFLRFEQNNYNFLHLYPNVHWFLLQAKKIFSVITLINMFVAKKYSFDLKVDGWRSAMLFVVQTNLVQRKNADASCVYCELFPC